MKRTGLVAFVVLAALLLWAVVFPWAGAQSSSLADRWEYFTLTAAVRDTDFRSRLNAQGDGGWELITFVPIGDFQTYIFKRALK